jgi:hypothetical protein
MLLNQSPRGQRFTLPACGCCVTVLLVLLVAPCAIADKTGRISGVIFTLGPDRVQVVWPTARVTLKNLATRSEIAVSSDQLGVYTFFDEIPGDYEIEVNLAGFETQKKPLKVEAGHPARVDFQLVLKKRTETVQVTSETQGVDVTSSSGGTPTLTAGILKSVVQLSADFQQVLPLLPGVMRGPDGLLSIKGGRLNQTNALVNTATIADPFTGCPALKLPTVAVQSVRLLSNPFSSEYGGFASGVVEVNTRGGTDEWKWLFEDPIPRLRWIDLRPHGLESATPHLAVAGPLKRGKVYLFESNSYHYNTTDVPSLPDPNNIHVEESLNNYTQLDWDLNDSHRLTAVFAADPSEVDFATINTFNPQPVTADYRQRSFFTSLTDRWILANGGFVQSLFSVKRLDPHIYSADPLGTVMVFFPEQNSGAYFDTQRRRTRLYQWSQSLHLRPLESKGRHLVTLGYSFVRATYDGQVTNLPVSVLREDHTLSAQIKYPHATPAAAAAASNELAFFVQDSWQIHPRFVLDFGVRGDVDSLSAEAINFAPRVGFVVAPTSDGRTAIRGGFGVFFDKIPLNVAAFRDLPAQTITRYAMDGSTVVNGPKIFSHQIDTSDGHLRVPYSLGWDLQVDRELRRNMVFRLGYEQREVFRDFYLNPFEPAIGNAELGLFNSGRQTYREFLALLRWHATERTTLFASYVRSYAHGELNDYNQLFGNFPIPLIRANQNGPLPSDAPNRVLFWSVIGLPRKLEFVPVLDVHTGFPFSQLDENWNFVGQRNGAGRFPGFIGLDVKLQYPFDFKFHGRHFEFRAGLNVPNVLNHFNPRDVQEYAKSPNYGHFYNSVGRLWRIEGAFDF